MKKLLIIIFIISSLLGCVNEKPRAYKVDSELDEYAHRFFECAKKYGHNFDEEGLIMTFSKLDGNKAGICYMNRSPIQIEIDSAYWKEISDSYIADDLKENLVFHEMGHGFLQRYHINDVLENKDWKSMMCGDELPDGRASNINYRGMRKSYYQEELFTQTTNIPSWSTFKPDFTDMFKNEVFSLSMDTTKCQFKLGKSDMFYGRIENNEYIATAYNTNLTVTSLNAVNTLEDFCVEANIKILSNSGKDLAYSGICFGSPNYNSDNFNIHYITIDSNKHAFIGENNCLSPFIDLYLNNFTPGDYNKIKIYKQGQFLYYFINDTFIYHNDIDDLIQGGNNLGLLIYAQNTVYVKDLKIYKDNIPERNTKKVVPQIHETTTPYIIKKSY